MIEQHDIRIIGSHCHLDFIGLAAADEEARIRTISPAADLGDGHGAGREGQLLEFLDVFGIRGCAYPEAHEDGPLTCAWSLEQALLPSCGPGMRAR